MSFLLHFFAALILVAGWQLLLIGALQMLIGRQPETSVALEALTRAPMLDLFLAALTWIPWLVAILAAGWGGLFGALVASAGVLVAWVQWHERQHAAAAAGPGIKKVLNRIVGPIPNHGALWVTLIAYPGFWLIRLHEIFVYPLLIWLLDFPRYTSGDWVNVSRQKFSGLIGHDLIWCLYCDWMTGVYSLGAEMLRNVESFWCPIRFYDGKKCENCKMDFPDINGGWVPETGTMSDVAAVVSEKYATGDRTWFGHPARLTVRGKEPD
ncbi:MAG TPA: hypothetical protein VHY37_04415 [Tepidisphaeraceae bacterium]|jgi:hypothetical protein|nr:hypothetical protein [Tepidisphaeraceae bacterium]